MAQDQSMKAVRLYDTELFITARVAGELFEGNESQAIRHMIRDYGKRNLVAEPQRQPAGNGQAALVDPPAPYRAPVLREEVGHSKE